MLMKIVQALFSRVLSGYCWGPASGAFAGLATSMMRLPAESVVTRQTLSLTAAACLLLAGCADNTDTPLQVEQPVDALYRDALNTTLAGDSERSRAQI